MQHDLGTEPQVDALSEEKRRAAEVQGKIVEADMSRPFESPAAEFVPGPYYADADEVLPELSAQDESTGATDVKPSVGRRDFMKLFSASTVFASTACVRRPVEKAIPYVNQPIDQVPGVPTYYATTCGDCSAACGIVVKTREGRPVKVEGNPENPISQGGSCALGQSTLQALYHPERRKKPAVRVGGSLHDAEWREWLESLGSKLAGKNVGILTGSATGNRHNFFRTFLKKIGSKASNLYTYDSNSLLSATVEANKIAFGFEGMPRVEFRKSEIIVGIGTDFLDVGTSPVYNAKSFSEAYNFRFGKMGRFVAFETSMTQTGARASERHVIPAGHEILTALLLVKHLDAQSTARGSQAERSEIRKVLAKHAAVLDRAYNTLGVTKDSMDKLANDLLSAPALVMVGGSQSFDENATALQLAGIMANTLIGAYGTTLFIDRGWMVAPVKPGDTGRFLQEAASLDALIVIDSNPAFTMPASSGIRDILKKIPMVVSLQNMPCETDEYASFVGNTHHFLEAWGDEQPVAGFWSARQPAVRPAFNSRQAEDVLLWAAAAMNKPLGYREYRDYLKERWSSVHKLLNAPIDYDTFFDAVLRRGFSGRLARQSVRQLNGLAGVFKFEEPSNKEFVLISPLDVRLRDGVGANRPILQEVGDGMTTIAWDSWVAMNPERARDMGLRRNDVVKVTGAGGSFEGAVYPLPGLHKNTIVVPRGNGHSAGLSKITDNNGTDPLVAYAKRSDLMSGDLVTAVEEVKVEKTGRYYRLAYQQKHNDIANRKDIVKTMSLEKAKANMEKKVELDKVPDLYPKLDEGVEYRWGLSVDLTACTGCSSCMVACGQENNVPQIGREEVVMGREMHWIRLDRYFRGDVNNPDVTFQPVMCQQCNHAPCEAVCPVYATTHDPEGINSQTYNRCIGTRYCANACPYKVRRFNWYTHKWNVMGERAMDRNPRALNPDVSVRTRGIMEKCTFCYQRIRDAKHTALEQKKKVTDGMLQTACQQACPTNAITFGDLNNPRSSVARLRQDNRAFLMLGADPSHGHYGLKTLPNVNYLSKVTLNELKDESDHHGESHHG